MIIKQIADKILKLLYEYFTEHNAKELLAKEDILGFLEKSYGDYQIDAAIEFLIESGLIKGSLNQHNLPQYKITPEGVIRFESQNQAQQGYCPVYNFHIEGGNNNYIGTKDGQHLQVNYQRSIPSYYESVKNLINTT